MNVRAVIVQNILEKSAKKKKDKAQPPPTPSHIPTATLKKGTSSHPSPPLSTEVATILEKNIPIQEIVDPEGQFMQYSPKLRRFMKEYFRTGSATEAAQRSYDCKDRAIAAQIGSRLVAKYSVPFAALLDAKGVTLGSLIKTVKEAQHATKFVRTSSKEGADWKEVPDHNIRIKAATIGGNWSGITTPTQTGPNVQINNIIGEAKKKYDI